jgi:hypothetical protein
VQEAPGAQEAQHHQIGTQALDLTDRHPPEEPEEPEELEEPEEPEEVQEVPWDHHLTGSTPRGTLLQPDGQRTRGNTEIREHTGTRGTGGRGDPPCN